MKACIAVLLGDGIGPEVMKCALSVLDSAAVRFGHRFEYKYLPIGGAAIDRYGCPLPDSTLQECMNADAVILGAVGGPKWESCAQRPEDGLLALRKAMGIFANLRPLKVPLEVVGYSPLRTREVLGADLLVVRELCSGIYYGSPREESAQWALDTMKYTHEEVRRVARVAFAMAAGRRGRVTSVDKANVLASSRLWRSVVIQTSTEFPGVELEHQLVDAAGFEIVHNPRHFDVILAGNLFGDILSDVAGALTGSLGMLPSASVGQAGPGLFEPVHGSAPAIAGQGLANPIGAILSAAMLCRDGLGLVDTAAAIEQAVWAALKRGCFTQDLQSAGSVSTERFTSEVLKDLCAADARPKAS